MGTQTHGLARRSNRHPLYPIWQSMKQRCENPTAQAYYRYGGRGITVCKRWSKSFTAFLEDMGPRPEGYTLERINNDRGYGPRNCTWATRQQQYANRGKAGSRMHPDDWARSRVRHRLACISAAALRKSPPKICEHCGTKYTHRQGHTQHPPRFCSVKCYGLSKRNPPRICEWCHKSFIPKIRKTTAKFCGRPCFEQYQRWKYRKVHGATPST